MRLSDATLNALPNSIRVPSYDRAAVQTGIVHLGVGAFHRAHMAAYIDDCLASDPRWGICGVSLRSASTRDALAPQDGLFTMAVQSTEGLSLRVIGAMKSLILAPEEPKRLAEIMCAGTTRIVSLTVTEKGYCHDPATGRLNQEHPDIVHDLRTVSHPRSAIGWLAYGILERRARGIAPFTILSCDNLPSNGPTVRQVLLDYLSIKAPNGPAWAERELAFPATMVDRIVPATTDEDRALIATTLGQEDAWPVLAEPFSQFVVEDNFTLDRPAWEASGVTMASDVAPFERMKLRMLNGSHSTLAYLGYLAGHETIADTMGDPPFKALVGDLMMKDIAPTLTVPDGVDLLAYSDALIERFSNTALKHRTWQIAMDGSQKLPQRLLGTIADRLEADADINRLALGVAAWMRYACGSDEKNQPIDVRDPLADSFRAIAAASDGSAKDLARRFFELDTVFGNTLPADKTFQSAIIAQLDMLLQHGARSSVQAVLDLP
jgi:fructuronate reductase